MRGRLFLAVLLVAALGLTEGPRVARAQPAPPSATIAATDAATPGQLQIVLEVVDSAGRPVPGMVANQFRARVQGADAAIKQVTPVTDAGLPIDVVLVLDTSGSMAGTPLDQARAAARAFVAGLAPADRVAVISFGDSVVLVQDFTADHAVLDQALDSLSAEGNTALYQATVESLARASLAASTRRAVILLSDGVDYGGRSRVSRDEALDQASRQGIPVFTIGLGSEIDADYLSTIASRTSGQYLAAPTGDALARLYEDIGARLRGQYVLTVDTAAADPARPLTLHIEALPLGAVAPAVAETTLQPTAAPALILSVSGVDPGETVEGDRTVSISGTGAPLISVVFRLDGVATTATAPPFEYHLSGLPAGSHQLEVSAVAADGQRATTTLQFTSAAPPSAAAPGQGAARPWALVPVAVGAVATAAILYVRARRRAHQRALAAASSATERARRGERTDSPPESTDLAPETPQEDAATPQPETEAVDAPDQEPEAAATGPQRSKLLAMLAGDEPPPTPEFPEEPLGRLVAVGGPLAGQQFPVGASPITVGCGYRSHVRLPVEAADASVEEVRLWVRRGRLMYHRVARLRAVPDEWTGPEWLVFEAGEQFNIGRQAFRFEVSEPAEPEPSEEGGPVATGDAAALPDDDPAPQESKRVVHMPRRRARRAAPQTTEVDVSILREDSTLRRSLETVDPAPGDDLSDEDFNGADI